MAKEIGRTEQHGKFRVSFHPDHTHADKKTL
ncbi:hypothetical protein COLO4_14792 [Corchorus olitorius]|uniref:Uncharacterized protein n=1 Tax=Corchorus olitorius TaxID=93759 RepID=A0A1R3JR46_9ROSI|nr:hypothetical protein COLO4_14792 [Corchorus olitorius]